MTWWVAGAAVVGAVVGADSNRSAANTQADATRSAVDTQNHQYDQTRQDFAPWRAAGQQALGQLQTDINTPTTAADVMSDPGYQFGMQQGQQALDRKIAAMGGRVSGAAIKQSVRYATDYGSTGYNAAYQRRQDRLNRLAALAGIGQTATGSSAAAGSQAANAISQLTSNQGDAAAASRIANGNIWANAGNQIAALYNQNRQPNNNAFWNGSGSGSYAGYQNSGGFYPYGGSGFDVGNGG